MVIRERYESLLKLALTEYPKIVTGGSMVGGTALKSRLLRTLLTDDSYLDIRLSADAYAFHWERRAIDGTLFRWDDAPHHQEIPTFPHHLHNGSESHVVESQLPVVSPSMGLRYVLSFIENWLDEARG